VPAPADQLFRTKCGKCHTVVATEPSSGKGPSLAHLPSRESLGGGIQRNTPENLMLWLTDPQAAKPGNRMPTPKLTPEERRMILAFLETVR
jgi:cytochrome c oxidase subunit II